MKPDMPSRRFRSRLAKGTVITVLAAAAVATANPAAFAGTSSTTNGCYSTWGSTGSNAHCQSVTDAGTYRNIGICDYSSDQDSGPFWFTWHSSHPNWGQVDCLFSISKSYVTYSLG